MKPFFNPFAGLSGTASLALGAVGLLAMAGAAHAVGGTFRGVVSQGIGELSFWQLVLQQAAGWAVFATLLYGAARLLCGAKVRAVEVYGPQLMARLPLAAILLGGALPCVRFSADQMLLLTPEEALARIDLAALTIFGCVALGVLAWYFAWSYLGFATAVGLRGWKTATAYVVCYLLAEAVASWCTTRIGMW